MKLTDYLIDQCAYDWPAVLRPWSWRLPPQFTLWLVNRFGDLFMVLGDGSVHVLRTDSGELSQIADSRERFANLLAQNDNAADWLLIPLVDELVSSGAVLKPGQCYGFKVSPVVGGAYHVANVTPRDLAEYHSFLADFYAQINTLPDGTRIRIQVV